MSLNTFVSISIFVSISAWLIDTITQMLIDTKALIDTISQMLIDTKSLIDTIGYSDIEYSDNLVTVTGFW